MHSNQIGDISELKVATRLMELGHTVSMPVGNTSRYDLLLDNGNSILRIQVKTARWHSDKDCIAFDVKSYNVNTKVNKDYHGDVDYFGVYFPDNDKCYFIPINICGISTKTLRINSTKNGQKYGVHFAEDFEM